MDCLGDLSVFDSSHSVEEILLRISGHQPCHFLKAMEKPNDGTETSDRRFPIFPFKDPPWLLCFFWGFTMISHGHVVKFCRYCAWSGGQEQVWGTQMKAKLETPFFSVTSLPTKSHARWWCGNGKSVKLWSNNAWNFGDLDERIT